MNNLSLAHGGQEEVRTRQDLGLKRLEHRSIARKSSSREVRTNIRHALIASDSEDVDTEEFEEAGAALLALSRRHEGSR